MIIKADKEVEKYIGQDTAYDPKAIERMCSDTQNYFLNLEQSKPFVDAGIRIFTSKIDELLKYKPNGYEELICHIIKQKEFRTIAIYDRGLSFFSVTGLLYNLESETKENLESVYRLTNSISEFEELYIKLRFLFRRMQFDMDSRSYEELIIRKGYSVYVPIVLLNQMKIGNLGRVSSALAEAYCKADKIWEALFVLGAMEEYVGEGEKEYIINTRKRILELSGDE